MTAVEARPGPRPQVREVFRGVASSVAVVTALHHGRPVGLLVTSLTSVSSDPPLLSFNVARRSSSWDALHATDVLGVHVLSAGQRALAERFARSGEDRYAAPTVWHVAPEGVPVLRHVASVSVVRVRERLAVADHAIVVAELVRADVRPGVPPLLHHDGAFQPLRSVPEGGRGRLRLVGQEEGS